MTTRAELRTRVREELNDSGSVKLWADGLLNRWIGEAIRGWSRVVPYERSWEATSAANEPSYVLPADVLEVVRVEHPAGVFRAPGGLRGGDSDSAVSVDVLPGPGPMRLQWEVWDGALVLIPAPGADGEPIAVRYRGAAAVPTDDVAALAVTVEDEEALVLATCSRALRWIGLDEAKRQRFERERGADPAALRGEYERALLTLAQRRRGGARPRRLVVRQ